MLLPAVAVMVPLESPLRISSAEGTVRLGLSLLIATTLKPIDAWFNVIVHELVPPAITLAGLQVTEFGPTGTSAMVTLLVLFPSVAVTIADWLLVSAAVVTLNVSVVLPASTVTPDGTVRAVFVFVKATAVAAGAAL